MLDILAVGAGGFAGAVCRYLIGLVPVNENFVFPVKTFIINVIGCAVIGVIAVMASKNTQISPNTLLFLKVGLCGGFTTFSTFALETADLVKGGHTAAAFIYVLLSVLAGTAVIFIAEYLMAK